MKNAILLVLMLLVAIIGGAGLFYIESKLPDNELLNRDVNAQLLKIDGLDSSINELALRSRANIDSNYDKLVRNTVSLEGAVKELSAGNFAQQQIAGSLLETRFDRFKNSIEIKLDQVENFKSNNSVLRNSDKYTPIVGSELASIAKQNLLPEISDNYKKIVLSVLEFTKQGSNKDPAELAAFAHSIQQTEPLMPAESSIKIAEFANHVTTAIDSKSKTDQYLNRVLNASTNDQIEDISSAWALWQTENNNTQKTLRYYTLGYLFLILTLLGMLVYRLRSLYNNLDYQVEAKTEEVRTAYEELHDSERRLEQREKMAALGQLVEGVAHDVNTPLTHITSNMNTLQARFNLLEPVLLSVGAMSKTISDPNRDKGAINLLLKKQIVAYRNIGKSNTPEDIRTLISDSSDGLNEIKAVVNSLTSFSHVPNTPEQNVNINASLELCLKDASQKIGARKIVSNLSASTPTVSGVPTQLVQVFTNILSNAVQATDPKRGVISIETQLVGVGSRVNIIFKDNGRGIDDESLKRVFDPFFTTREVGHATGLGLSIAHRIVEAHAGKLNIESRLNEGTTVTLTIPAVETI